MFVERRHAFHLSDSADCYQMFSYLALCNENYVLETRDLRNSAYFQVLKGCILERLLCISGA